MNPNIRFGVAVTNNGTRNVETVPELVATTTTGGFRITPQVSRKLGLKSGDYVMFLNNHDDIRVAVESRSQLAIDACAEIGISVEDANAAELLIKNFGQYFIAKGIRLLDSRGVAIKCADRMSMNQKVAVIAQNFEEALAAALASDSSELVDALTAEGVTKEQQVAILAESYNAPEVDKYLGSKTCNPSGNPAVGVTLTFSDSAAWAALHEGADKNISRSYSIDLSQASKASINNGYEDVEVTLLPLGEFADTEVASRARK